MSTRGRNGRTAGRVAEQRRRLHPRRPRELDETGADVGEALARAARPPPGAPSRRGPRSARGGRRPRPGASARPRRRGGRAARGARAPSGSTADGRHARLGPAVVRRRALEPAHRPRARRPREPGTSRPARRRPASATTARASRSARLRRDDRDAAHPRRDGALNRSHPATSSRTSPSAPGGRLERRRSRGARRLARSATTPTTAAPALAVPADHRLRVPLDPRPPARLRAPELVRARRRRRAPRRRRREAMAPASLDGLRPRSRRRRASTSRPAGRLTAAPSERSPRATRTARAPPTQARASGASASTRRAHATRGTRGRRRARRSPDRPRPTRRERPAGRPASAPARAAGQARDRLPSSKGATARGRAGTRAGPRCWPARTSRRAPERRRRAPGGSQPARSRRWRSVVAAIARCAVATSAPTSPWRPYGPAASAASASPVEPRARQRRAPARGRAGGRGGAVPGRFPRPSRRSFRPRLHAGEPPRRRARGRAPPPARGSAAPRPRRPRGAPVPRPPAPRRRSATSLSAAGLRPLAGAAAVRPPAASRAGGGQPPLDGLLGCPADTLALLLDRVEREEERRQLAGELVADRGGHRGRSAEAVEDRADRSHPATMQPRGRRGHPRRTDAACGHSVPGCGKEAGSGAPPSGSGALDTFLTSCLSQAAQGGQARPLPGAGALLDRSATSCQEAPMSVMDRRVFLVRSAAVAGGLAIAGPLEAFRARLAAPGRSPRPATGRW